MTKRKSVSSLSVADRITAAKAKTTRVVDHLLHLLALHANNAIISYSPALASQIPASYAANAFQVFQHGLHRFEIVRLCALWDSIDADKENIPTIVELVDHPEVIDALVKETESHWENLEGAIFNQPEDTDERRAVERSLKESNVIFGREQGAKSRARLHSAIASARALKKSNKLASITNLRDKSLAHSLTITNMEKSGPVDPMKYGYERDVLNETVLIVEGLYLGVNGASFDFDESRRIAESNAKALWDGCRFNVVK